MEQSKTNILLAFYGDDFTGTTATAETLSEAGVSTIVFTEPPTIEYITTNFPSVKAVGVAGVARALPIHEMEKTLRPVFERIKDYQAPIILYKVCSTFDSSADVGNIGKAIELGREIFGSNSVPVIPAAPNFGRYTVFGHHFATLGIGTVYRLDRHPSMSNHPITPMHESDLRMHLAEQTDLQSDIIDIFALERGEDHIQMLWNQIRDDGTPIILFDTLSEAHLLSFSKAAWRLASKKSPIFIVGSHELGSGFSQVWLQARLTQEKTPEPDYLETSSEEPILVISGSCATVTGEQIIWAINNGFSEIRIQPHKLLDPEQREEEEKRIFDSAMNALRNGVSVVAHTSIGGVDDRTYLMELKSKELALSYENANKKIFGAIGGCVREIVQQSGVKRLVLAGGDTSGRIQKYLDIQALQIAKSVGFDAPICYVYSSRSYINGMEIAFKGGQAGSVDYFGKVQSANTLDFEQAALGKF